MNKSKKVNRRGIKTQSCKHKKKVRSIKKQMGGGPAEWLNNITSSGGRLSQLHSIIKDLSKEEWRNLKAHLITASGANVLDVKWEKLHPTLSDIATPETDKASSRVATPETDKASPRVATPETDKPSPRVATPETDKPSPRVATPETDKPSPRVATPESDKPSLEVNSQTPETFKFGGRRTRRQRKKSSK